MNDSSQPRVDFNMNSLEPITCTSTLSVEGGHLMTCDRVPNGLRACVRSHHLQGHGVILSQEGKAASTRPSQPDEHSGGDGSFTRLKDPGSRSDQTSTGTPRQEDQGKDEQKEEVMISEVEGEDEGDEPHEATRERACLVKLYAYLKEEMTRAGARAVSAYLFQHQERLLSPTDHESICHCSKRRQAVEQLLKKVVKGPSAMYRVFLEALKKQEEEHLAKKICETQLSDEELDVFMKLEDFSMNRCKQRPNSQLPRFKLSTSNFDTLVYYLNCKNVIDCLNDKFLSSFIFSIREHTNVWLHSMNEEGRVRRLLATMLLCEEAIFEVLCRSLVEQSMPNVIEKLEGQLPDCVRVRQRKKRSRPEDAAEGLSQDGDSSSTKRQRVSSAAEVRAVTSLASTNSELRHHALDEIGFDIEHVNKGSIVIQLCPKKPDSWQRLKDNCLSGNIKEFIPKVYSNDEVKDLLQEGEYRLQFTIYVLPAPKHLQDQEKVMFHLETEPDKMEGKVKPVQTTENPIEDHMDLLVEELEISKDLLTLLKEEGIVKDSIKEELDKQGGRAKKIRFLLNQIATHGKKGYEILKSFIKDDNEDLYKELVTKETISTIGEQLPQAAKVTKGSTTSPATPVGSHKRELFFKGTVILKVKKGTTKENVDPETKSGSHLEITCPAIVDPVCYFSPKGDSDVSPNTGELTMVLEEEWSTGPEPSPQREIKIGKRKLGHKQSSGGRKKQHNHDGSDSEADQDLIDRGGRQPMPKEKEADGESKETVHSDEDKTETEEPGK